MRVRTATGGGHVGRPNEDFVGTVGNAVVLLDGAGIPGTGALCHHGTAWYAGALGHALLDGLTTGPPAGLRVVLAGAITTVADLHRDTCDIEHGSSPQATVVIVRVEPERAEHLVLGDSTLLVDTGGGDPLVVTDGREVALRRRLDALLEGLAPGTPEHDAALDAYVAQLRARRNRPGGYWVAKDHPGAAREALLGGLPRREGTILTLLSNGVTRLVDGHRLLTWPELAERCRTDGPDAVLTLLRAHEARVDPDRTDTDDATVAVCSPW